MKHHHPHPVEVDPASSHSVFKVIVGICIIVVLFYYALKGFSQIMTGVDKQRYELMANRFDRSMSYVHQHWMMAGKPKNITLPYIVEKNVEYPLKVAVNLQGWPINVGEDQNTLNCLALWMYFAHDVDQPQGGFNLTDGLNVSSENNECYYFDTSEDKKTLMFRYQPLIGSVTLSIE